MLIFFITYNYYISYIFCVIIIKLNFCRIFHFKWKGYIALIFLFFCSLLSLFLCLTSPNILKILIFFLGSVFCFISFLESWISYFFLIIYVGGLFILLLYISTFSFSEIKEIYFISFFMFLSFIFYFFRTNSYPLIFTFFVNNRYLYFVILILFLIFLGLYILSFFLPRGICSKSNF